MPATRLARTPQELEEVLALPLVAILVVMQALLAVMEVASVYPEVPRLSLAVPVDP